MPALTVNQIRNTLGSYVEAGGDFIASLNQVLARIYSIGTYRDLTVQYSLPVVDSHVTLPDDADAIFVRFVADIADVIAKTLAQQPDRLKSSHFAKCHDRSVA